MRYLLLHGTKPYESLTYAQNALSFELQTLAEFLQEKYGAEVHIASPHNVASVPLAEFDSIVLNCFGDGDSVCETWLANVLPAFAGKVYWLMTDPAFFAVPERHLPKVKWQNKLIGLFAGAEFARYSPACQQGYWPLPVSHTMCFDGYWHYMWQKQALTSAKQNARKAFDLVYAGRARSQERMHTLEWLIYGSGLESMTIGWAPTVRSTKVTNKPVMPFRRCLQLQQQAISTIVLGDPGYEQLLPRPHRLLQAWALGLIGFIYEPFDSNRECLAKMPASLQGLLYVSSPVQLRRAHETFAQEPGILNAIIANQRTLLNNH